MNNIYLYGLLKGMETEDYDAFNSYSTKLIVNSNANFYDPFGKNQDLNLDVYLWKGAKNKLKKDDVGKAKLLIQGRLDKIDEKIIIVAEQIRQI